MHPPQVVHYTRNGCCLCQEAELVLKDSGLTPELVDIDADPELLARFSCTVPVVAIDGKVRFRGRVEGGIDRRVQRVAGMLNLATQRDLRALQRRIRHLEQELREAEERLTDAEDAREAPAHS
jgi:glutaredoxin